MDSPKSALELLDPEGVMQQRVAVQLCPGATRTNVDISLHMNVVYIRVYIYQCICIDSPKSALELFDLVGVV